MDKRRPKSKNKKNHKPKPGNKNKKKRHHGRKQKPKHQQPPYSTEFYNEDCRIPTRRKGLGFPHQKQKTAVQPQFPKSDHQILVTGLHHWSLHFVAGGRLDDKREETFILDEVNQNNVEPQTCENTPLQVVNTELVEIGSLPDDLKTNSLPSCSLEFAELNHQSEVSSSSEDIEDELAMDYLANLDIDSYVDRLDPISYLKANVMHEQYDGFPIEGDDSGTCSESEEEEEEDNEDEDEDEDNDDDEEEEEDEYKLEHGLKDLDFQELQVELERDNPANFFKDMFNENALASILFGNIEENESNRFEVPPGFNFWSMNEQETNSTKEEVKFRAISDASFYAMLEQDLDPYPRSFKSRYERSRLKSKGSTDLFGQGPGKRVFKLENADDLLPGKEYSHKKQKNSVRAMLDLMDINEMIQSFLQDLQSTESGMYRDSMNLPPLKRKMRVGVKHLAKLYGLVTKSFGKGIHRHMVVFRTKTTKIPSETDLKECLSLYCSADQLAQEKRRQHIPIRFSAPAPLPGEKVGRYAKPVDESNKGNIMLRKMGWSTGDRLGANGNGIIDAIDAFYKVDRTGIGFGANNE